MFFIIWELGASRCVQNTPTGCRNIFHTRQAHPQDFSKTRFFPTSLDIFPSLIGGTLPPLWETEVYGDSVAHRGGPPIKHTILEGWHHQYGGNPPMRDRSRWGFRRKKKYWEWEAEGRLGVGGLGGRSPPNGRCKKSKKVWSSNAEPTLTPTNICTFVIQFVSNLRLYNLLVTSRCLILILWCPYIILHFFCKTLSCAPLGIDLL